MLYSSSNGVNLTQQQYGVAGALSGSFQMQADEIKNSIKTRSLVTIQDCLGYKPHVATSAVSTVVRVPQQQVFQSTNEMAATNVMRGNSNNSRTEVLNTSIRSVSGDKSRLAQSASQSLFPSEGERLVVVEKNSRARKQQTYEAELRNLRKANNSLNSRLTELKEIGEQNMPEMNTLKSALKNSSFTQQGSSNALGGGSVILSQQMNGQFRQLGKESDKSESKKVQPNPYENKKMLSQMRTSVIEGARKEAFKKQEDGCEVNEMRGKRNEAEERKVQVEKELEKENTKLRNKAIRATLEVETYESKAKEADVAKNSHIQETKIRQNDLKQKQSEYSAMLSRKSKIETEATSQQLILKDREADLIRLADKLKLNAKDRQKTLHDLELHVSKRNIAQMDFEKVRSDRDRIMEEIEKRQVEADNKYSQLNAKYLNSQVELQALELQITTLDTFIAEEKTDLQKQQMQNKILLEKQSELQHLERKLRKREKHILQLEQELELVRRERKIEIVERLVEKPIVIEKPVVIEKEVIIREEIKVDEPLEKELAVLREETALMSTSLKDRTQEVEYWKKRFQDSELQGKYDVSNLQQTFEGQRQSLQIHYEKGVDEIRSLQAKLNALLAEIHSLSNINLSKNREMQDTLQMLARDNLSLENAIISKPYSSTLLPRHIVYQ